MFEENSVTINYLANPGHKIIPSLTRCFWDLILSSTISIIIYVNIINVESNIHIYIYSIHLPVIAPQIIYPVFIFGLS